LLRLDAPDRGRVGQDEGGETEMPMVRDAGVAVGGPPPGTGRLGGRGGRAGRTRHPVLPVAQVGRRRARWSAASWTLALAAAWALAVATGAPSARAQPADAASAAPAAAATATTAPDAAPASARGSGGWGQAETGPDGERVHRQGGDVFLAGGTPAVTEPVGGDLFIAGGSMDVEAPVAGDVFAIGGRLRVSADIGQSLYALGGQVELRARAARNLRVAGGQVDVAAQGSVGGNVSAVGGQLRLRGPVLGHVLVAGGRVLIDAPVAGDVTATSGELVLGPAARIGGRLRYRSGDELRSDPAAVVAGGVERLTLPPRREGGDGRDWRDEGPAGREPGHRAAIAGLGLAWTAGLMVLAGVLLVALPGLMTGVSRTLRGRIGPSLGLGFALVVCVPVAVLVLLLTVVGIPVALLALALYFAALPLAYVAGAIGLADAALARWQAARAGHRGWRFGAACAVLLGLALAGALPVVGWAVGLAVLLLGLGAIVLNLLRPSPAAG
jgi:hypothetical protein